MTESLSNRLLDKNYIPSSTAKELSSSSSKFSCPVKFTEDPLEYCESKEFLGARLRKKQRDFIYDLYSLDSSNYPNYDAGVLIAGMRGGKSMLAAIVASFQVHRLLALDSPAEALHQMRGQRITVQFIASTEAQAKETAYAAFETVLTESYWWIQYIRWLQSQEESLGMPKGSLFEKSTTKIEFGEKNIAILSLHSNSASLAGKTSACCIFDELSRFDVAEGAVQTKSQKRTAQAVYNTVARAATSLVPFSKVLTITSPMYEDDYGMRLLYKCGKFIGGVKSGIIHTLRKQYPEKVERMVGYHSTTFELNPKYDEKGQIVPGGFSEDDAFFKSVKVADPEAFNRDYYALPPSAVSPFFEFPERIDKCISKEKEPKVLFTTTEFEESLETNGRLEVRAYVGKKIQVIKSDKFTSYFLSCDQGEKKDAFVVAMAHGEPVSYDTIDSSGKTVSLERYKVVVDFIEGWVPDKERRTTVSFPNVDDTIISLNDYFYVKKVVFDQWNSTESIQRLFSRGILTEKTKASDNMRKYELLKTLMYSGLVELPENDRLHKELRQLNSIKGVKVDHPAEGSSDFCDAIARVVWEVYIEVIEAAIQGDYIHPVSQALPIHRSMATFQDFSNPEIMNQYSQTQPFGAAISSKEIFGQGCMVQQNVFPNLHTK